ncbi:MAG: metallophosphoesterase, partial [Bacilli bacterium]|nr:metallophosphoesterase [Bacilli bacterium]
MIKKVFHISDIHIPNSEEIKPFSEMVTQFLAELYNEVKDLDKDEFRIVIAGDIFDQKIRTSNEAKEIFHTMLNYLNAIGTTIIIAGNHDMLENNKDRKDSISPTFAIKNVYEKVTYLDKELNYLSG